MRDLIIDVLEETGWTWEWLGGRIIVHDGRDGVFELIPLDAGERLWIAYVTDGRGMPSPGRCTPATRRPSAVSSAGWPVGTHERDAVNGKDRIMTAKRCYVYGSTAVDRRLNRKASRRQARLALAHGLEPEPRYPRDREYLD